MTSLYIDDDIDTTVVDPLCPGHTMIGLPIASMGYTQKQAVTRYHRHITGGRHSYAVTLIDAWGNNPNAI